MPCLRCVALRARREVRAQVFHVAEGWSDTAESLTPLMMDDRRVTAAIDKLVEGPRDIIELMSADERKRLLSSIRAISSDFADRLEAPSDRKH
jgi:hypothetical protein